jgi:hypothetical protein
MTPQQAPAAVRVIDVAMLRQIQIERPDRMYRRAQRDVVDHVRLRQKKTSSDANSSREIKFLIFPEKQGVPSKLSQWPSSRHAPAVDETGEEAGPATKPKDVSSA